MFNKKYRNKELRTRNDIMTYKAKDSPLLKKSFSFAIEVVNLSKHLSQNKKEFILSKQLVRSGTGIGANIEEANGAISDKDFKNKITIAYKEARETIYWLRLLHATNYNDRLQFDQLFKCCEEICKMFRSSINTLINKC
jgi:four helix bundle protein